MGFFTTLIRMIIGLIVSLIGIAIGYVDYYIISKFYEASLWVSEYLHAPYAVTFVITIILSLSFLGIILIIAFIALVVFLASLKIIVE